MRLRIATETDAVELAELRWQWRTEDDPDREAREDRPTFVERFTNFVRDGARDGRWTVWVADDGDRIASNIWVYRVPKVPSPGSAVRDFGYVTNVYTRPEMRNRGVGAELLAAVTAWAHDADLEMLIVWPSGRSVPWYQHAGFVPSEEMLELVISGYEG